MSTETNGEKKSLMYVSAVWPVMAGMLVATWFLATSLANLSSQKEQHNEMRREVDILKDKMANVQAQNDVSIHDRADTKIQVEKLQDSYSTLLSKVSSADAIQTKDVVEIETQVDSMNQALGIQFADQKRHDGGVDNALHEIGAKFPEAPVGPWSFPNISNRHH